MIENRPDWCISRQRTWGVPITLFVHKETDELHPNSVELMESVAQKIEKQGIQAWWDLDAQELLGDEAEQYRKVSDTWMCGLIQVPRIPLWSGRAVNTPGKMVSRRRSICTWKARISIAAGSSRH